MEKFFESTNIKLTAIVSDLLGSSSRAIFGALIDGERDPSKLANLATRTMRRRIPELVEALTGRFTQHHGFICRMRLERVDSINVWVDELTERIEMTIGPFRVVRDFLTTTPGVNTIVANVLVAETGADMSRFESPGRLLSWAGVAPGSNGSASRIKSTGPGPASGIRHPASTK